MAKLKVLGEVIVDKKTAVQEPFLTEGAVYIQGDEVSPNLQQSIALFKNYPESFEALDKEAEAAVDYLERSSEGK